MVDRWHGDLRPEVEIGQTAGIPNPFDRQIRYQRPDLSEICTAIVYAEQAIG